MRAALVAGAIAGMLTAQAADPDFSGCLPPEVKTVGIVMPGSVLAREHFDKGVRSLEKAGYRVKLPGRLAFDRQAPVADRASDFEEMWLDPEVDIVVCARGGKGSEDVIRAVDWQKLAKRPDQRVLGFSNITMILNAMLKKGVGHPFSGPSLGQMTTCKGDTLEWLGKAVAGKPLPPTQLRAIKSGAFSGLPCGGHIGLVRLGIDLGWAANASNRVVFLERNNSATVEGIRRELDVIADSGFLDGAVGVIFGDVTPGAADFGDGWGNSTALSPEALEAARCRMEQVKRAFAEKVRCPVYDGFVYGHIPVSHTIDFRRRVSVSSSGLMTWE